MNSTFGSNLKKLRKSMRLRQSDLAEILGVKAATISLYETGKNYPTGENLIKLSKYFNVSVDDILGSPQNVEQMQTSSILGIRINTLRKQNGLTQNELGKILGVENSTISMYERGNAEPSNDSLIKMSNLFNVSVDYILGISDKPKIKKRSIHEIIEDFYTLLNTGGYELSYEKKKMLARIIKATIEEE